MTAICGLIASPACNNCPVTTELTPPAPIMTAPRGVLPATPEATAATPPAASNSPALCESAFMLFT